MKLRCTEEDCPSRKDGDTPVFTTTLTIDDDGAPCSTPQDIAGKDCTCCYCESDAEWVQDNEKKKETEE